MEELGLGDFMRLSKDCSVILLSLPPSSARSPDGKRKRKNGQCSLKTSMSGEPGCMYPFSAPLTPSDHMGPSLGLGSLLTPPLSPGRASYRAWDGFAWG